LNGNNQHIFPILSIDELRLSHPNLTDEELNDIAVGLQVLSAIIVEYINESQ
jgi:hypothetical protein